ncbi:MAG: aquaporin [Fimbriimonadaceae bacterium]|nr:aquaporin [Fimbriimonadaceae bacterium]QYK59275.1 MAG: aquaporin [Fimbriimonadaceae bacterium]
MAKLLTELVGTFFLVFTIGLVVATGSPIAVIAIGVVLMAMIYMGGHVSGAHYNPAVSTALLVSKKMEAKDYAPYVVVQLVAGVLAAFASYFVTGKSFAPAPGQGVELAQALLVEVLFTFALAITVLNVACSKKTEGKGFYGLAIGFVIVAAALSAGGVSGGAFNPAVGIGPTLVHAAVGGGSLEHVWLYIVGPVTGALLATAVFKVQEGSE